MRLFLAGDVMTGRGIDQVLPHPSDPRIYEPLATSAIDYVELAERAHGAIARGVDYTYVWGDALAALDRRRPDARIVNLETSVTGSDAAEPKGINYRMHPSNVAVLGAAGIHCCALGNNHVLDWGAAGLLETLDTIQAAGIATVGAGRDQDDAERPAVLPVGGRGRVLVFALGARDSGIPPGWAAKPRTPGVFLLGDFSDAAVRRITELIAPVKRVGDTVIVSIHWGPNWGYDVPGEHRRFAHALLDRAGVDVIHGHSSHHPKAIEVHEGRLILYGCGDFLNDYEGIGAQHGFRHDLVLAYFPELDPSSGRLVALQMVPFQIRNFRLRRPSAADTTHLAAEMDRECRRFGLGVAEQENNLALVTSRSSGAGGS